jgi:hypothetical protein
MCRTLIDQRRVVCLQVEMTKEAEQFVPPGFKLVMKEKVRCLAGGMSKAGASGSMAKSDPPWLTCPAAALLPARSTRRSWVASSWSLRTAWWT